MVELFSPHQFKRRPAVRKMLASISPEHDVRVRVLGRVLDVSNTLLVLDDGTKTMDIINQLDMPITPHTLVRVFARVLPVEQGFELHAELIQDMSKLDVETYQKVFLSQG